MTMGEIKAKIQRVIFEKFNEKNDNYFYLLALTELDETFTEENGVSPSAISYAGKTKKVTLKGVFETTLKAGQCIKFTAKTIEDPKYGPQIELIKHLEFSYDEFNKETIVEYLKKSFKGLSNKDAISIVGKFGKDTIQNLANVNELTKIPGITKEKANAIVVQHTANDELVSLMKAFENIGVEAPVSMAISIIEKYGKEEAFNMIVEKPYQLYEDGICPFSTSTMIATRRNSPNEIILGYDKVEYVRACILSVFEELENNGHCCISDWNLFHVVRSRIKSTLVEYGSLLRNRVMDVRTNEEFAEDEDLNKSRIIILCIKSLIENGILEKEKFITNGEEMNFLYRKEVYEAEKYAAKKIMQLCHPDEEQDVPDADAIIAEMENEFGIKYADCQRDAIKAPLSSHCVIITGGPGTGKTTTVKGVIEFQKRVNPNLTIFCAAPTGRASQRMAEATGYDAKTVHRMLEVDPTNGLLSFKHNLNNPLECDLIIIDEFSMVDIILFGALMRAVKPTTKIIFVGDKNQLPSVGPGSVLRDMIESHKVPAVELEVVFRQGAGSLIAYNADKIKNNLISEIVTTKAGEERDSGNFFAFNAKDNDSIRKRVLDLFQTNLNKYKDIYQVQVLCPVKKATYVLGGAALNPILRDIANPRADKKAEYRDSHGKCLFREGDKVMQKKNNYGKDVFNGDQGIIQKIDTNAKEFIVKFQFKKELVTYEFSELAEIDLAYAITIHKSQGSEYKCAIVPISPDYNGQSFNSKNLLYTGITRAKDVFYFVGEAAAVNFGLHNTETTNRCTTLCQRISGDRYVEDIGGNALLTEIE